MPNPNILRSLIKSTFCDEVLLNLSVEGRNNKDSLVNIGFYHILVEIFKKIDVKFLEDEESTRGFKFTAQRYTNNAKTRVMQKHKKSELLHIHILCNFCWKAMNFGFKFVRVFRFGVFLFLSREMHLKVNLA